jgi:hypothetical protein
MGGRKVRFAKDAQVKDENSDDDIWDEVTEWHVLFGAPNVWSNMFNMACSVWCS